MEYGQAKALRGSSLSSLITQRLVDNRGIGSSIGSSISDKFKAQLTGVKEAFDPLNIAKKLTFGSKLAPALLGRMTGRKQSDIEYFTGRRATPMNNFMGGDMTSPGMSDGAVEVLNEMFQFMKKTHEESVKYKEVQNSFREENANEDERRHTEFIKAIREFTGIKTGTLVVEKAKDEGGGILDFVKTMFESLKASILSTVENMIKDALKVFEWIRNAGPVLRAIAGLAEWGALVNLLPLAAVLAPWMLSAQEKEKIRANPNAPEYKDNPYAMFIRGEAKSEGAATEQNVRKAAKQVPRRTVKEFVDSKMTDDELKQELGNDRTALKQWLVENPKQSAMYQAPVAPVAGQPQTATPASAPAATAQTATPATTVTPTPPAPTTTSEPTSTPIPPTPTSSGVSAATDENVSLNLAPTTTGSSAPIVMNSVNNSSTQAPEIPTTATQRDDTAILSWVFNQSKSMV